MPKPVPNTKLNNITHSQFIFLVKNLNKTNTKKNTIKANNEIQFTSKIKSIIISPLKKYEKGIIIQ